MRRAWLYFTILLSAFNLTGCADAGKDQTVYSGQQVILDGSGSKAAVGGEIVSYEWKQVRGKRVELQSENEPMPYFVAPEVKEKTWLRFKLTVKEVGGKISPFITHDFVTVYVLPKTEYDTEPPTITLLGENPLRILQGERFVDPGAEAIDNVDGNITDRIETTSNVDTTTPGEYVILYKVQDSAGNEATATRTVIVNEDEGASVIEGRVVDLNDSPIAQATVKVDETMVQTDTEGRFTLRYSGESQELQITASHPNYFANTQQFNLNEKDLEIKIALDAPSVTWAIKSDQGGKVEHASGAAVVLPANGYVDEEGNRYTGEVVVKMSHHFITTLDGLEAFPKPFVGIDGNETSPIKSYGFMNVELSDPSGKKLQLDGNATATLLFPIDNAIYLSSYYPDTISLWYYDHERKLWVKESEAERVYENGRSLYKGEVKHFTTWNLDAKGPRAAYKGKVVLENGEPAKGASVFFSSVNWQSRVVVADGNGAIDVINALANEPLTVTAYLVQDNQWFEGSKEIYLAEGEERIDSEDLILKPITIRSGEDTFEGVLQQFGYSGGSYEPLPFENIRIYAVMPNGDMVSVATVTTDANGKFSYTFAPTGDTVVYRLIYSVVDRGYASYNVVLQPKKYRYDVVMTAGFDVN